MRFAWLLPAFLFGLLFAFGLDHWFERPHFPLLALALGLAVLVALAALYLRSTQEKDDLTRLELLARTHCLGNTIALRPFQKVEMQDPCAWSEYSHSLEEPASVREHVLGPCILCILTIFSVASILFLAFERELYAIPSMILGGALHVGAAAADCPERCDPAVEQVLNQHQIGSLQVMMYSFLAAYIWAIWQLFHRMVTRDVTVYAFHAITVRVVTTVILALIIYQALAQPPALSTEIPQSTATTASAVDQAGASDENGAGDEAIAQADAEPGGFNPLSVFSDGFSFNTMILLAFFVGFFPETALRWLANKARRFFRSAEASAYLDMEAIEGIDTFTRARLAENGILDASHLATTNPMTLALRTPYSLSQIVDWIGQAQLLTLFKPGAFDTLRMTGVRTSYQFYNRPGEPPPEALIAKAALEADPSFIRLREVLDRMNAIRSPPS